jgi:hypothetical protein
VYGWRETVSHFAVHRAPAGMGSSSPALLEAAAAALEEDEEDDDSSEANDVAARSAVGRRLRSLILRLRC